MAGGDTITKAAGTYLGFMTGGVLGGLAGSKAGDAISNLGKPTPPTLLAPNALSATPTQADAAAAAGKATLDRERQAASTSTILSGGAGLLDQPTTTSRTLLGS